MKKIYIVLLGILMMSGCASDIDMDTMSAEDLYNMAYENLGATKYAKAAEIFEKVETDHPYSRWAVKSKLMGAFAYYKDEKYDEAVMAIDRFLKYHPGNKDVPYALYLKGMCYYDQISAADKDQGNTALAAETFERLIIMFPDSKYAKNAMGKMDLTEDYKAGQEMIVGRYYLHEGNYLSAINRFNVVLEQYQRTVQIEEALYRQVEIYAILGLNNYADGYYKILQKNYPEGKWTAKAAKVMQKIGAETKPNAAETGIKDAKTIEEAKSAAEEETTEKKGWFSGWFGSKEDEATEAAEEVKTEVKETKSAAEEETTEKKDWFSGWFSGEDDEAATAVEEVKAEAEEAKSAAEEEATEKKGWFSGWFGSKDDEAAEAAEEVKAEVEETKSAAEEEATEKKGWFSGWFSGEDDEAAEAAEEVKTEVKETKSAAEEEASEKKGWFSGWFGSKEDEAAEAAEEVKTEVKETKSSAEEEATEKKGWFSGLFSGGTVMDGEEGAE